MEDGRSPALRVLVVEDCSDTAVALKMLLDFWGHQTWTVGDGLSAITAAREHQPEVVLLDVSLPGISGYEVARLLRTQTTMKKAVLVTISGYVDDVDRQRSYQSGCDLHMSKPVEPDLLKMLLEEWKARVRT